MFLEFLRQIHRKYGRIPVFVDNAPWHKSAAVREVHKEFNWEVKLAFYPSCTPELNAMEQWNVVRNSIGNRAYTDTTEMALSIRKMIRERPMGPVEMGSYPVPWPYDKKI